MSLNPPRTGKRALPVGLRARKRKLCMSHALGAKVEAVLAAEGMGLAEFFAALVNQGIVARLPVLASVLPPPPSPDEAAVIRKRLQDAARRADMEIVGAKYV